MAGQPARPGRGARRVPHLELGGGRRHRRRDLGRPARRPGHRRPGRRGGRDPADGRRHGPKPKKPARKAQVLGVGADGRKQYTVDRDARAGHRSATNSRPAGPYIGYELHLAVQARDVRWTNGVDKTSLSDEVPGVVTCFSLVPAGTHRGKAIVDDLIAAKTAGEPIDDVVWDPGLLACASPAPCTTAGPGRHPPDLPARHPPARHPPVLRRRPADRRAALLEPAARRAARPARHRPGVRARPRSLRGEVQPAGPVADDAPRPPDADGATRWRCPFCAGFLRSRNFPKTMRRPKTVPLVPVAEGCDKCCNGILTAQAGEMAWWQRITYGTTAWRISMGRRQVVESVNAALKGDVHRSRPRVHPGHGRDQDDRHARLHAGRLQPGPDPQLPGQARPRRTRPARPRSPSRPEPAGAPAPGPT